MPRFLLRPLALALFTLSLAAHAEDALRVGDQQLQARGVLEASGQLKDVPYKVEWFNFPAAQPLGEALNAGAVDLGGLGDAPTIFAYAAGAKVRVIAATRSTPTDLAILVPADSPLKTPADLKGKRLATTRGSIGHFLAVSSLERAGIALTDVSFSFLQPADAKAALAAGSVDAWATWDPYVAFAEMKNGDRSIGNAVGLSSGLSFELATTDALQKKHAQIADFVKRLAAAQRWALAHPDAVAAIQSRVSGLPVDVLKVVYQRGAIHPVPIDDRVIADQQKTADLYVRAGVIKSHLDVAPSFDRTFTPPAP